MFVRHIANDVQPVRCTRCNEWVTKCLRLGDEPDCESYTVNVCLPCARLTVLDIEQALAAQEGK